MLSYKMLSTVEATESGLNKLRHNFVDEFITVTYNLLQPLRLLVKPYTLYNRTLSWLSLSGVFILTALFILNSWLGLWHCELHLISTVCPGVRGRTVRRRCTWAAAPVTTTSQSCSCSRALLPTIPTTWAGQVQHAGLALDHYKIAHK